MFRPNWTGNGGVGSWYRHRGGFRAISTQARWEDASAVEAQLTALSHRLAALRDAISLLDQADTLRSDAAARLSMYRQNEERLAREIQDLERARVRSEWLRAGEGDGDGGNGSGGIVDDLLEQLAADRAARDAGA